MFCCLLVSERSCEISLFVAWSQKWLLDPMFVIKSGGFFNFLSEDFKGLFVYGVDRFDFLGLCVLDGVPGDLDIEWPDFYSMKI